MNETPEQRAIRKAGKTMRAFARASWLADRMGEYDLSAIGGSLFALLNSIPALAPLAAGGFPVSNTLRWVPIGPSVSRTGSGDEWRKSSGRVKDLAVSDDGKRIYAATATGGVWYSENAGATWAPIGGWANRARRVGGPNNAQSCTTILVKFGGSAATDFVMVGTGMGDMVWNRTPNRPALGGVGVLAALNPAATAGVGGDPWEPESGISQMEGKGVFRLARDPRALAGTAAGPHPDRVFAATNQGLFFGTRGPAASGGSEFTWVEKPALDAFMGLPAGSKPIVTDVMWFDDPDPAKPGRIIIGVCRAMDTLTTPAAPGAGVAFSDDLGGSFHWVTNLDMTVMAPSAVGRISMSRAAATNRIYAVVDLAAGAGNTAALFQIPDVTAGPPVATRVPGVPAGLWGAQRDWDQCIVVDVIGGPTDRVYLGGSFTVRGGTVLVGGVWCFDVDPGPTLIPAPGVSRTGLPPGGEGATIGGLIGDEVHPDIQALKLAGLGANRQLWLACDGGVYVSMRAGRVNTFMPRNNGLGAIEANFLATHPTSSHYLAIGTQDNGRHMRVGDTVWEETVGGDGGGVIFNTVNSQFLLSQATSADWSCTPNSGYEHPLNRLPIGRAFGREATLSGFYSGAASVTKPPSTGRMALGTNRVWLTDNLGAAVPNTWKTLPYPGGAAADACPSGTDLLPNMGVPRGAPLPAAPTGTSPLGVILTQKWASPTQLLVLYQNGLIRWTETAPNTWSSQILVAPAGVVLAPAIAGAPNPATTNLSDIAPVPGTQDFYLTTTGNPAAAADDTCFFFDNAGNRFLATDLRNQLPAVPPLSRPLDPAYAAVVHPTTATTVYVGTVSGVWQGTRTPGVAPHGWTPLVNGLPQAAVQDLSIFHQAAAPATMLLRAAIQARGVWELDIGNGTEPERTYIKVHARDDRRRLPVPMANPRRRPGATGEPTFASPDIVVRPQPGWMLPAFPRWQLGADTIRAGNAPPYQLWTFQTAFRWLFPSVVADGLWSRSLGELVMVHRAALGMPIVPNINQALWEAVVRDTHLDATGVVTPPAAGDPLAVYRPPWATPGAMDAIATEIDILDYVVAPPPVVTNVQPLFNELSTVDVLIHHRDTRPLNANEAFVILLRRHAINQGAALAPATIGGIPAYVASVLTAEAITTPPGTLPTALPSDPTGWTLMRNGAGRALHTLNTKLDARIPRAVSINVDLSAPGVPAGSFVLFLAIVGSTKDPCPLPGSQPALPALPGSPAMADLVKLWPYAAMRLITVSVRP